MPEILSSKYYIHYSIKALCVKAWFYHAKPNNIYELDKCYHYNGVEQGYKVNGYTFQTTNSEGVQCQIVLMQKEFDKYFVEVPGTYIEA